MSLFDKFGKGKRNREPEIFSEVPEFFMERSEPTVENVTREMSVVSKPVTADGGDGLALDDLLVEPNEQAPAEPAPETPDDGSWDDLLADGGAGQTAPAAAPADDVSDLLSDFAPDETDGTVVAPDADLFDEEMFAEEAARTPLSEEAVDALLTVDGSDMITDVSDEELRRLSETVFEQGEESDASTVEIRRLSSELFPTFEEPEEAAPVNAVPVNAAPADAELADIESFTAEPVNAAAAIPENESVPAENGAAPEALFAAPVIDEPVADEPVIDESSNVEPVDEAEYALPEDGTELVPPAEQFFEESAEGGEASASAGVARDKIVKIIRTSVMAVCGVVLAVCVVLIGYNLWSKWKGGQIYDSDEVNKILNRKGELSVLYKDETAGRVNDLHEIITEPVVTEPGVTDPVVTNPPVTNPPVTNPPVTNPPVTEPVQDDQQVIISEMRNLILRRKQNDNGDIFGYIVIDGTEINYPLVRGTDNDFYLNHDAYSKGKLAVGAIFIDYRLSTVLSQNYNTVIYGHNMDNGSMFHDVTKFANKTVFKNTLIYIYTVEGLYIYKPFCYYKPDKASGYTKTSFMSGDTFAEFAKNLQELSTISSNHTFTANDRIITLSTCLNSTTTSRYRYVLHAYLTEFIAYQK